MLSKEEIENILKDIEKYFKEVPKHLNNMYPIDHNQYELLKKYIKQLESEKQNLIEKLEKDIQKADSIINDEEFRYIQEVIDEQYERKKYAEEILEILEVQNEQ